VSKRPIEPFLWTLFSGGGVLAAFFAPVMLFALFLALPLSHAPSYGALHALVAMPVVRLFLFVVCSVPLFHWAHRFRYTLYDGLQIKHLNEFIDILCYGGAVVGTLLAALLLWNFS
jgi:fumarate reductase subunit D